MVRRAVRLLLVAHDVLWRDCLVTALRAHGAFASLNAAPGHDEAVALLASHHPDVVVVDERLPGGTAAKLVRLVAAGAPGRQALVLGGSHPAPQMWECVEAVIAGRTPRAAGR